MKPQTCPKSTAAEDSSTNSSGSSNDTTLKKPRGATMVQSRYMQEYEKKKVVKVNLGNATICSGGKPPERTGSGTPTRRSMAPQKFRAPTGPSTGNLDSTLFVKGDLQSTLLEGHKIAPPDFDISVINAKTFQQKMPKSLFKADSKPPQKTSPHVPVAAEVAIGMSESQLLDLALLRLEVQKNIRRLEDKAEQSLLLICAEREKLQKKVHEQRRQLRLQKREQQLSEVLCSQAEVLVPTAAEDEAFKSEYKSFATALDSTRHELPIKHIHVQGSRQNYLDELQKHLMVTESLLADFMPSCSDENANVATATRDLEEVVLKIDTDLPRTLTHIIDLAFKVSKETSLHNQKVIEDTQGVETMKSWYFDESFVV